MSSLHDKLLADYTLFNLNDPSTTRFYIRRMDYLIANFPYFKDIAIVGDYFTSNNPKFAAKFRSRLPKFMEIIYKVEGDAVHGAAGGEGGDNCAGCGKSCLYGSGIVSTINNPPAIPFTTPQNSDRSTITHLYPSDESGPDSDTTVLSEETGSNDMNIAQEGSEHGDARELGESLSTLAINGGSGGVHTDTSAYSTCSQHSSSNVPSGVEFTSNPATVVLKHYSRVIHAHIGSFAVTSKFVQALIEKLEYDDIHNLLIVLLQNGTILPMLIKNNCVVRIINKNLKSLHALLEGVLYSSRNNIEDEEDFVDQVEMYKEVLLDRFVQIGVEHGCISSNANAEGSGGDEDGDDSSNAAAAVHTPSAHAPTFPINISVEFTTIYKILHLICLNRASVNIKHASIIKVDRFCLYYLRILSYNPSFNDPAFTKHLISLFFSNPSNSHLLSSIVRIIVKTPLETLGSAGLFERMYSACYGYVSRTKGGKRRDSNGDGSDRRDVCSASDVNINNSLFSFLVRLYIRYSAYIKTTYPGWDVFHELMDTPCRLEKAKYTEDCFDLLVEYEGFQRYVVENMLNSLPYPSIFKKS